MGLQDKKNNHQIKKNIYFFQSFGHAIDGIKIALHEEKNLKRDLIFIILVIAFGMIFHVTHLDWVLLILAISLVVISEMWNTVIENIMDFVTKKHYFPHAKKIKDMSAGTVLLAVIFSVIVGLYVFVPYLLKFLF